MKKGFVDIQVNGYAGVDFNADKLSVEQIRTACLKLRHDRVEHILATVLTDDLALMEFRLKRLADACLEDRLVGEVIAGLHVEGPFISPVDGYRGAHPASAVRPASVEAAKRLLAAGGGRVRIITLAPECDPGFAVTRYLVESGVRVAAGHTDASFETLQAACDAGLTIFTHMGNGCPAEIPRHDNIIERALALRERLWFCFIADGAHIPFFALSNYLALVGIERSVVVSDAIAAAGSGPGRYRVGHLEIEVGDDLVARQPGNRLLAGAAVTISAAAANLSCHLQLGDDQIERLTMVNPQLLIA